MKPGFVFISMSVCLFVTTSYTCTYLPWTFTAD